MGMSFARTRPYFSARTGKNPELMQLDLNTLKQLVLSTFTRLQNEGYFAEQFGYWCVDAEDVPGKAGADLENYALFHLRRPGLWPIQDRLSSYDENDLFDMIEFLHDHTSKPLTGHFHSYAGCGMHWATFDKAAGQKEYRDVLNGLLECYDPGYELNERGEIMEIGPPGLKHLPASKLPTSDLTVLQQVQGAIDRYRRYGASMKERRNAVRELADVLEWLRPQIKTTLLKKDEADLFQLANNFGIRHLNQSQRLEYDEAVWLSWMFYHYLATIYAFHHLLERQKSGKPKLT